MTFCLFSSNHKWKSDSLFTLPVILCLKTTWQKMKLNDLQKQNSDRQKSWQQAKHVELYSDLPKAWKWEPLTSLGPQQRRPNTDLQPRLTTAGHCPWSCSLVFESHCTKRFCLWPCPSLRRTSFRCFLGHPFSLYTFTFSSFSTLVPGWRLDDA